MYTYCTPIECVDDTVVVLWWWHLVVSGSKLAVQLLSLFYWFERVWPVRDEGQSAQHKKGGILLKTGSFFLKKMKRR